MKGIILAAGKGARLYPMTKPVCKPLLPIYDKPLIYYPLSALLQAGITDILIIIPPDTEDTFRSVLGDGSKWGISIRYQVQQVARGIADAFIIGQEFIGTENVCLVLGDNIFYSPDFCDILQTVKEPIVGATVFGCRVKDPRPFGVIEFDQDGSAVSIEEKPSEPKSEYIVPGLYFYDNQVVKMAGKLQPSDRGELEITDINIKYMKQNQLQVIPLHEDFLWKDAGTADTLLDAGNAVKALHSKGITLGRIEEIAFRMKRIDATQLYELGKELECTEYGKALIELAKKNLGQR